MGPKGARHRHDLPWQYRLTVQWWCQCWCSALALASSGALLSMALLQPEHSISPSWRYASIAVTGVAILLDLGGLSVLLVLPRRPVLVLLTLPLLYNVAVMMAYYVFYLVFAYTGVDGRRGVLFPIEVSLTTALVLLAFAQLYSGIYYFRLLRYRRLFLSLAASSPTDEGVVVVVVVPGDVLVEAMRALGQNPTVTEMAELLSSYEEERGGPLSFTFPDFCALQARYAVIRARRARSRRRQRSRKGLSEPLLQIT